MIIQITPGTNTIFPELLTALIYQGKIQKFARWKVTKNFELRQYRTFWM